MLYNESVQDYRKSLVIVQEFYDSAMSDVEGGPFFVPDEIREHERYVLYVDALREARESKVKTQQQAQRLRCQGLMRIESPG